MQRTRQFQHFQLLLVFTDRAGVNEDATCGFHFGGQCQEKVWSQGVGNQPRAAGSRADKFRGVSWIAEHSGGAGESKILQPRGTPMKTAQPGFEHLCHLDHISVQRNDTGKPGKNGADCAVWFRPLAMDDVGSYPPKALSRGTDATLVGRSKPADFRDVLAVKPDVPSQLWRSIDGLSRWRNNMHLDFRHTCKTIQDRLWSRPKMGLWVFVVIRNPPVVRGQEGELHASGRAGVWHSVHAIRAQWRRKTKIESRHASLAKWALRNDRLLLSTLSP